MTGFIIKQIVARVRQNRILSLVILFGLTFSFTSCLLIALWVNDEFGVDRFHQNGGSLYKLYTDYRRPDGSIITKTNAFYPIKDVLDNSVAGVDATVIMNKGDVLISIPNKSFKASGYYASGNFFEIFSFPLLSGDAYKALNDRYAIVLSESMTKKIFPGVLYEKVLGKTVFINDSIPLHVEGVFSELTPQSSLSFDFIISMELNLYLYPWNKEFGNHNHLLFVKAEPGFEIHKIADNTNKAVDRLMGSNENKPRFWFQPFSDTYLHSNVASGQVKGGRIDFVLIFAAVGVLVLLLAIVNYTSLTIAKNSKYAKDVAVQKYLGSSKTLISFAIYVETAVMIIISTFLAFVSVNLIQPYFNSLTGKELTLNFTDLNFLIVLFIVLGVVVIVAGAYPAARYTSAAPVELFKHRSSSSSALGSVGKFLVGVQFILCMTVVGLAFILKSQVAFIMKKNLGFTSEHIVTYSVPTRDTMRIEAMNKLLQQSSAIVSISGADQMPMDVRHKNGSIKWLGKQDADAIEFSHMTISADFAKTLNIPLVLGREFSRDFPADKWNFILNETAVKLMGLQDPIGTHIEGLGKSGVVIGVVEDYHNQSLYFPITPMILHMGQPEVLLVKITGMEGMRALENAHHKIFPDLPLEYNFLDDKINVTYKSELILSRVIEYFAVLALAISLLGLLGLVSFSTQTRMKEIGVRRVFGASSPTIAIFLAKDYLRVVLAGLTISMPLIYFLAQQWLSRFSFAMKISVLDFMIPAVIIICISIAVILFHVVRASSINPSRILRYE